MSGAISGLELGPFLVFGGSPGSPLPDLSAFKVARHTKGNAEGIKAERPAIRHVPKSHFTKYESSVQVYEALFGAP
ncbi:hypothetical protein [Halomonas saccharevitans]|uniref:hypothetical protein n=1 Tax=Halomonas saccharevitans TaxID=416872 RepID=UPI001587C4DA|nr:hypothetical protein [Halomonas saccharevitans]